MARCIERDLERDRSQDVSGVALARLWLVTTALSIGLFSFAVNQSRLVLGTLSVLAASILGMIAVFVPIVYIAQSHRAFRVSTKMLLLSIGLLSTGLIAASVGFRQENQLVTALGVYVAVHGGACMADWFNQRFQPGSDAHRQTLYVVGANAAIGVTTLLAAYVLDSFGAFTVVVIVAWLLAIVVLKLAVVQYVEAEGALRELRLSLTWGTSVVALVVALVLLVFFSGFTSAILAGSLLVAGLSVLGLLLHNDVPFPERFGGRPALKNLLEESPDDQRTALTNGGTGLVGAIAFVAAVGSFLVFVGLIEETNSAVAAVVAVMIIGAFFVLPGETIMVAVLLSLLVVWVANDTDSASAEADNAVSIEADDWNGEWIVAFGDSFISGEGAPLYYEGTNSPGSNDCRRAPTSFPRRVGDELGLPVQSFACSGAVINNLARGGQAQEPSSPRAFAIGLTQLEAAATWLDAADTPDEADVNAVFVNIGGNDAGFTALIAACLTPGADCEEVAEPFFARTDALEDPLVEVYGEIRELFPSPRILVTLAPDVIGESGVDCSLVMSDAEALFIREVRDRLNDRTRSAVSRFNMQLEAGEDSIEIVESGSSLVGHELCGDERYVNWLRLTPPDGAFSRAVNPSNWKNGSLHPGPNGHCVTALLVLDALDLPGTQRTFEDCERPAGTDAVVPVTMPAAPEICTTTPDPLERGECSDAWVLDALRSGARALLSASALGVVGGIAVARALSQRRATRRLPFIESVWSVIVRVWLDYDRVAGGARAKERNDQRSAILTPDERT